MSYLTVEVEIDHGRVVAAEAGKLPDKGRGLLTVLEAANCDHWLDRGALGWYDDPYYGDVFTQKVLYKMSESPPRLKHVHRPVGCDNEEIYQRVCGLSSDQIRELEAKEVI